MMGDMDKTNQPQPARTTVHPALADPPARRVVGMYVCRAQACGRTSVSYDENPPAQCRNDKCSGVYADAAKGRWMKCKSPDDGAVSPLGQAIIDQRAVPEPPPIAPLAPAPAPEISVAVGPAPAELPETRVSVAPETRRVSAEEYRGEWVADRVAADWDKGAALPSGVDIEAFQVGAQPGGRRGVSLVWDAAEALYDEGKKRGHLP
jgi:hypothetical protein